MKPSLLFVGSMITACLGAADANLTFREALEELNFPEELVTGDYEGPPNELYPQDSIPILERADSGAYVSVGTERSFIGASLSSKFSHLLILDQSPATIRYARINIALLQAAGSRGEYLQLRSGAQMKDWQNVSDNPYVDSQSRKVLRSVDEYIFMKNYIRNNWVFESPRGGQFLGANYLYSEVQFQRLHRMARAGKIAAVLFDLRSVANIRRLVSFLSSAKVAISVADISNAFHLPFNLKPVPGFQDALLALANGMTPGGLFMYTLQNPLDIREYRNPDERSFWKYLAATPTYLSEHPDHFANLNFEQLATNEILGMSNAVVVEPPPSREPIRVAKRTLLERAAIRIKRVCANFLRLKQFD